MMRATDKKEKGFVGYEYKDFTVRREMEALYADSFEQLGWQLDGTAPSLSQTTIRMKYKRDRKIPNKAELTRLQSEFECCVKQIEKLEASKAMASSAIAYGIGIAATVCMAGATCSYMASRIPLCVALAIPGLVGWAISYFVYNKVKLSKTKKVLPKIDSAYDAIYEICEKAGDLLCT